MILRSGDYANKNYRCNYLVIGTGAGGSVAGALLAEKGFDVILIEEGAYYPTSSFTNKVGDMTAKIYRNRGISPLIGKPLIALAEGRCVGGSTVINGEGLFRTPEKILEEWKKVHGLQGYSYSKLKKHFETIEKDLNVVVKSISKEKKTNLDSQKLIEGAKRLNWRTELVPRAVKDCKYTNSCSIGCPTGAKQSTLVTYLPRAIEAGAKIFSDCRVIKINHSKGVAYSVIAETSKDGKYKKIEIKFDYLVIAGGAIQTPHLIKKSKMSKTAGKDLQFHMNVKVIARFKDSVYAEQGTMFPVQIHEFENEDCYINTSTMKPSYLSMSLAIHGDKVITKAIKSYNEMVILNTTMRVESKAHIYSRIGKNPLVWYKFSPPDLLRIKTNIKRMCQVLFKAGAVEVYLPIKGASPHTSLESLDTLMNKIKPNDIDISTVHMMASCPMGTDLKKSVVDLNGNLRGMKNVLLADASILPSSIGQSPQETIMAMVHEVMRRHFDN
jgi:choline dehydrogenase-like flavoprotein